MLANPRCWLELDANALINNVERARACSDAKIMAVVKANAYGHGLEFVSTVLDPYVDSFAVAALDEAMALREVVADKQIVLLSGFYHSSQIETLVSHRITPVVFNLSQIGWLEEARIENLAVGLKVDTGMGRLGISPSKLVASVSRLQALGCDITLMSHFASADTPKSAQNEIQHLTFKLGSEWYSYTCSFANSAAILTRPQDHYEILRPGIMLYGASPIQGSSAQSLGLQPVMHLYANILDVKRVLKGGSVGYGATWVAEHDSVIGVVSIGYGDGYPRVISEAAEVVIGGRRYPVVGRVSMDSLTVLLDEQNPVNIGDRVELWGNNISVDEVADWAGTIAYELCCKITVRPQRIVISSSQQ